MTLRQTLLILGSATVASGLALGMAACNATPAPAAPTAPSARPAMSSDGPGMLATRKVQTVDICHLQNNDQYHLLSVAIEKEAEHLAHGDAHPGDCLNPIDGPQFTTTCTLQSGCIAGIPPGSDSGSSLDPGPGSSCGGSGDSGSLCQ